MKNKMKKFPFYDVILYIGVCVMLNILIEIVSRGNGKEALIYIKEHKKNFIYNSMIIMVLSSWIFLFKKRFLSFYLIAVAWISAAIANNFLIKFRGSPLTGTDLTMIKQGLTIADQYITLKEVILFIIAIIVVIAIAIVLWVVDKRKIKINYIRNIIIILLILVSFPMVTKKCQSNGIVARDFADLFYAYKSNGFTYSLLNTTFNKGIRKPENYNKNNVESIVDLIGGEKDTSASITYDEEPNVIIVQLESFFDPTWVNNLEFDVDPIPNFRNLMSEYSSGLISVPAIGGGTANTEFEVITGMSLDFFAQGEFPYNTILKKEKVDSISTVLKEQGYTAQGIHNHEGTFYDRYKIYENLGFDTFTSIENMSNYSRNETGWVKDEILVSEIIDILDSTESKDLVYAVSVQGHGGYPGDDILTNKYVNITSDLEEGTKNSWEYFVNQLYEMDRFVADLIEGIREKHEPTIIAFFGDHLPGLNINNEDIVTNDMFITPYLIWDNMGLERVEKDIEAYQLTTEIISKIGLNGNSMNEIHKVKQNDDDYIETMKLLQYDLLYGNKYSYQNKDITNENTISLGFRPISISNISEDGDGIIINGENFTDYSKIFINNSKIETTFVNSSTLKIENRSIDDKDEIQVKQVGRNEIILGESQIYKRDY